MVPSVPCDEVSARGAGAEKRNSSSQASRWIILPQVSFQTAHVSVSRLKAARTTHAKYKPKLPLLLMMECTHVAGHLC